MIHQNKYQFHKCDIAKSYHVRYFNNHSTILQPTVSILLPDIEIVGREISDCDITAVQDSITAAGRRAYSSHNFFT